MTDDFYDLLEVPRDASQDEIKAAFREQVRVYHPDLNDDDRARAQFTALKKAYDILGDPVERKAYDRLGHEEYVAKRTSGIPSPDLWATDDGSDGSDSGDESDAAEPSGSDAETTSRASGSTRSTSGSTSPGSTDSRSSGSARSTSASRSRSSSGSRSRSSSGSARSDSSRSDSSRSRSATRGGSAGGSDGSSGAAAGRTASTGASTSASRTGPTTGGERASSATSGRADRTGRGTTSAGGSDAASTGDGRLGQERNAGRAGTVVAWLGRNSLGATPLWLLAAVYAAGLVQFALHNAADLRSIRAELAAAGPAPREVLTLLAEGRRGIDTAPAFLASVEPVDPPLPALEWYGALAGGVGAVLLAVLVARAVRGRLRARANRAETIAVAGSVLVATSLVGGPLLSGIVLLPALFGVVIRRTRHTSGWKPTYGYVLAVAAPAIGTAAALAGHATLATDLLAFVVAPLVAVAVLFLRVTAGPSLRPF